VNVDAPSLEATLVDEDDPHVNALGMNGVGEIGITGTAGAVANAVRTRPVFACANFRSRSIASTEPGETQRSASRGGDEMFCSR